jgi:hypothetical protein
MFRALIGCIAVFERPTKALGFMNVNLFHSNHGHVSVTHVVIFRMTRTRIQIKLYFDITPQLKIM